MVLRPPPHEIISGRIYRVQTVCYKQSWLAIFGPGTWESDVRSPVNRQDPTVIIGGAGDCKLAHDRISTIT